MFFFLELYLEVYRREIESFLEVVRRKHEVECTFADGVKAIRLAQAAKESVLTKKQ